MENLRQTIGVDLARTDEALSSGATTRLCRRPGAGPECEAAQDARAFGRSARMKTEPTPPADDIKHEILASTREAIVSRGLPPGTKLTESVIAETFGCGRGPVRWALARLQDEALVRLVPHRGAFVSEPTLDEAKNLFGAPRIMEGGIVRCLCAGGHQNHLGR